MVEYAEKYARYLQRHKIKSFEVEELNDENGSVIFRSQIPTHGQYVPLGVIFDQTIYAVIRVNIAPKAINDSNVFEVNNFILRLNQSNKLFKYYLAPDTSIILDVCVPMLPKHFSGELVQTVLGVVVQEVETRHGEFMKRIYQY